MKNARAKTINLLLYEGSLKGVISIADSSWNSGELFSAPRESVDDLISSEACNKYGVYLLLSEEQVYVGQSSDLAKRIKQHIIGKDWWERVVILTKSDDSLNRSDIDYLEAVLIKKASASNRLDCENKTKGNIQKVDKFRQVSLDQYLEEALFLMELLGINVFKNPRKKTVKPLIDTIPSSTEEKRQIRAKKEAKLFLKEFGVELDGEITYATSNDRGVCWANPNVKTLDSNWYLILNDINNNELIVLYMPQGTCSIDDSASNLLFARNDRPDRIELKISTESLIDKTSNVDFSPYVINRIKY